MFVAKSSLGAVFTLAVLLGSLNAVAAAETAADIPKNSYYDDPLTQSERSGIAEEENVLPSDGAPSVPDPADDGVIPDATIDQRGGAMPVGEQAGKVKPGESEADVILQDSKKNDKVTRKDMANCMKDWGPQTQMTKEEWEASCRTTLEYFPDGP